jgi:hypothetical protein
MLHPPQLDHGWGEDDYVPDEAEITLDNVESGHGVKQGDTQAWKNKRNEWAQSMWLHRNDVNRLTPWF